MKTNKNEVNIKIAGIGGGGTNAVERMLESGIPLVEYITINTDHGGFNKSHARTKIQIGKRETCGRGAGSIPQRGFESAHENQKEIEDAIKDCDMLFITAGMGGGTGTGAAPVVAEIAKKCGILTVAVVTKPFSFEGKMRMSNALLGIDKLKENADAIVIVPNENLKKVAESRITLSNAFEIADNVLMKAVRNLVEVIQNTAFINCDFSDICSILKNSGKLHLAEGFAKGDRRAEKLISQISENILLDTSVNNSKRILLCVTAAKNVGLDEIDMIITSVSEKASNDAQIIFGINFDEKINDGIKIVLISTLE